MTSPWDGANEWAIDLSAAALLMGAKHGESFSHMSAVQEAAGKWRGCFFCWLLGRVWTPFGRGLVEPNHCANVLAVDGPPSSQAAKDRAGICLIIAAGIAWTLPLDSYLLLRWAL